MSPISTAVLNTQTLNKGYLFFYLFPTWKGFTFEGQRTWPGFSVRGPVSVELCRHAAPSNHLP